MYIVKDHLYHDVIDIKLFKHRENAEQYVRNRYATIEEIEFVDKEDKQ